MHGLAHAVDVQFGESTMLKTESNTPHVLSLQKKLAIVMRHFQGFVFSSFAGVSLTAGRSWG
jgi:hypothetical protein